MTVNLDFEDAERLDSTLLRIEVGEREYALPLRYLTGVQRAEDIQPMPDMSNAFRGVTTRHGAVLPLLDLRVRFGGEPIELHPRSLFVVAQIPQKGEAERALVGLLAESVLGVVHADPESLLHPPEYIRAQDDEGLVERVLRHDQRLVFVLSVPSIVAS